MLKPGETVITYTYDFGDDWVHTIRITDIRQGEPGIGYPRYIAGERNGPPEDCGGVPGFYDVLGNCINCTAPGSLDGRLHYAAHGRFWSSHL